MSQSSEQISTQMASAANIAKIWNFLYNVKAVPYNAKGDGTDETTAIQSAINAAIAAHSKCVFFPYGTYSATSLTGLDQVTLIGDNATLTVGGASQTVEQFGVGSSLVQGSTQNAALYATALEQTGIIPSGSLDHAKNAIANNKTLKVAFCGDSITEGLSQAIPDDGYVNRVANSLKTNFPNVNFSFFNFGVSGTTIGTINDPAFVGGSVDFIRPWATPGVSLSNQIKAFGPDLLVIAFGMNDSTLGDENEYNNLNTFVNTTKTWTPVPSIVVVPTMLPTTNTTYLNQDQMKTLRVARATREFGKDKGIAVADANRLFQILRDGKDDVLRAGYKETNWSDFSSTNWTRDKSSFSLNGATLAPVGAISGKFVKRIRDFYNGTIEVNVTPAGTTAANAAWIDYRDSNLGRMICMVRAGVDSSSGFVEIYTDDSGTPLGTSPPLSIPVGVSTKIRIEANGSTHKVYVNDVLQLTVITPKKLHTGMINIGGSGLVPTFSNLSLMYKDPLQATPYYTEKDLLGAYVQPMSGNGANHPSGLGHALIYYPAFTGIIRELTEQKENNLFLPNRILTSGWSAPGSGYPATTTAGEKTYYKLMPKYDKYKGIALRRVDNGSYYNLSNVAVDTASLASLEPGKFAYYNADATNDFVWISVPAAGAVTWDIDLYKYQ